MDATGDQAAPPPAQGTFKESTIPATRWAHEYQSTHTETPTVDTSLLSHLNCSYFSNTGVPPTLLGLKQHAQSLAILIKQISVSTEFCLVDATDRIRGHVPPIRYLENEAFDYLTDLTRPYANDDEWHNVPLNNLANRIARTTQGGLEMVCPLARSRLVSVDAHGGRGRPFCSHAALAEHASDCLEILDHEFGATGGIMSMLPTDHELDREAMAAADDTFLGQMLLFQQALVGRMHELEVAYANALDTLRGEAAVPLQALSKASASSAAVGDQQDGGRVVGYPQDRFVLCNAGDDTFEFIHRVLDRQEALIEPKQEAWKAAGVVGERMWREHRGGDVYEAGLVAWDVKTRFLRMRGKGRSPIFVLPAHGEHAAVAETRKLEEAKPTVVSTRTPAWPAPVSLWQDKYQARLDKAVETERANRDLRAENTTLLAAQKLHQRELGQLRENAALYEAFYGLAGADAAAAAAAAAAAVDPKAAPPAEVAAQVETFMGYKRRNDAYEASWEQVYKVVPAQYHGKLDEVWEASLGKAGPGETGAPKGGQTQGQTQGQAQEAAPEVTMRDAR